MNTPSKPCRALVIENEYDTDVSIKAFLKDHPDLFQHVNHQRSCLNRAVEDLFQFIPEVDTVMIATTFMYPDQVVEYCQAFLQLPDNMKFNFFIHSCIHPFNDWKKCSSWDKDRIELRKLIIQIMGKGHRIFDFSECFGYETKIEDDFCGHMPYRRPYIYDEVAYDAEADLFYIPNREYFTLKDVQEDEK